MLTERQLFLFQVLVNDYIRSAEPVGSRAISKRDDVDYSPATIRNELADLEEMGFLEKPHSSSGRIPSEKGYRYYVDHLLSPAMLSTQELDNIKSTMVEEIFEYETLIQETAQILSEFTTYTSIVMGPELLETKLKHLQIISLSRETAVMIIVTNTGHVENRSITIPPGVQGHDIEKVVNILNDRLKGVPLFELDNKIQVEMRSFLRTHIRNSENIIQMLKGPMQANPFDHIFYGGKNNILSQPEFRDIDKVLPLLNALEQKEFVHELLQSSSSGIHIKIGQENALTAVKNCSLITATYSVGGEHMGTVAILGPTRMAYPRVVTLLDVVSQGLSKILTKRYQNGS